MNTMFNPMVPRLHAPIRGRISRIRYRDGLAGGLRDASDALWRIANSLDAFYGKPIRPRYGRRAAPGVAFCCGVLAGMGVMYLMDRDAGRRHRALMRDQLTHYRRVAERQLERKGRNLTHRVRGMVLARVRHAPDEVVDDVVLVERIRSHMGHLLSHAETRRIEVGVKDGQVTLNGHVVASHVNRVLGHMATVPGVRGLATSLTVHPSTEDMMGDQRGLHRSDAQMNRGAHGRMNNATPQQAYVPASVDQHGQPEEQQTAG